MLSFHQHRMMNTCRSLPTILLAVSVLISSSSANAQFVEEIVVTAQKRNESLQDVPVAVTALSAEMVDQARITQVDHLVHMVPSLSVQKGYSNRSSAFSIRGIGTQAFSSAVEPSVSMVVDGVVMGRSGQAFSELPDVERIEVLRGPQGTLFGKNASAGLVHIITKPVAQSVEGAMTVTAATDDQYRIASTFSMPVSPSSGFRFTFYGRDQAAYINNIYERGDKLNGVKDTGARIKWRWSPSEVFNAVLRSDYADQRSNCCAPVLSRTERANFTEGVLPLQASRGNTQANVNGLHVADSRSFGHALDLNWQFDQHAIVSISAYREYGIVEGQDIDFLPTDIIHISLGDTQQRQWSQELRWASDYSGPINLILGVYYFEQELHRMYTRGALGTTSATIDARVRTRNQAGFSDFDIALSEALNISVGLRYTHETLRFEASRGAFAFQGLGVLENLQGETNDNDWSGKVALEWLGRRDGLWYLSWAQGYKGKAFNVQFDLTPETAEPLEPETGYAWELGHKGSFFENRVMLNLALFYTDYKDLQVQVQDPDSLTFSLVNAGKVSTRGLELDLIAYPMAQLQIIAGATWMNARIDQLLGALCSSGQVHRGECEEGVLDLSGKPLPFAPRVKFSVSAVYDLPLEVIPYDLLVGLLYRRQSQVELALDNDEQKQQSSYGLLDASITLRSHSEKLECLLFVKNITDRKYATTILDSPLDANGYVQFLSVDYERSLGVEFKYQW